MKTRQNIARPLTLVAVLARANGEHIRKETIMSRFMLRAATSALALALAQAASAQTTGSVVQWGNAAEWDLPSPNENFTAVATGFSHELGLRVDGSIATWGRDYYGETDVPKPNKHFVAVAAAFRHSLGLKRDGSIVAWGLNDEGQLDVPAPNSGFVARSEEHTV